LQIFCRPYIFEKRGKKTVKKEKNRDDDGARWIYGLLGRQAIWVMSDGCTAGAQPIN
jgi:hypothetical protein